MADKQTIQVYVRLCSEDTSDTCRELSFRLPGGFSQRELLEAGFAIDGNQAMCSVEQGHDKNVSLANALLEKQRELLAWFDARGYEVTFA